MTEGSRTAQIWVDRHKNLGFYEKVGFEGLGEAYNRHIYDLRETHFLKLARQHGAHHANRVLDVGSGNGFYIRLYGQLGLRDVHGLDLSPEAVRDLTDRFPAGRFYEHDITNPVPEKVVQDGFDWVSAMDMLYHIVEDSLFERALFNCGSAVAPGGTLLVSDNFPTRKQPTTPTQAFHTLDEHMDILRPLGFALCEVSPVFFISNGQVGAGGLSYAFAKRAWKTFVRNQTRAVRYLGPLGELAGNISGRVLTGLDRALQSQEFISGYSTKVAVFKRNRNPS